MEQLILAHLIGDYLLQNDSMAINKKQSSLYCLLHVVTYMLPFLFCIISPIQLILIAIQHFVQDRTQFVKWFMEATGKSGFTKPPTGPWSMIVVDNIFHIIWMAGVIKFL